MASTFGGIYQASGAMNVARYGLDITGQNIANANTPGYTRQRAEQSAIGTPVGVPRIHTGYTEQGGVTTDGANRLTDPVINARARTENARLAGASTTVTRMADLEDIFNEPTDNGLAAKLDTYWSAWGDVANDPGAKVPREMLINAATSVTVMLHSMDSALDNVAETAYGAMDATISEANTAATELADLNRQIVVGKASNLNVNTLLDRRDVLLGTLAATVGGKATLHANGSASVTVGGQELVSPVVQGPPSSPSTAQTITLPAYNSTTTDYQIQVNSANVTLSGGSAAAEHTALKDTIPQYRAALDNVAQNLADTSNGVQTGGYVVAGGAGTDMFAGTSAKDIALTTGFTWESIAASADSAGALNGDNALNASLLGKSTGSPDSAYKSLIGTLGMESSSAKQLEMTQGSITASVNVLQQQSSGVSFDEEVANMLTYQMAYQASARVLTTLDGMLDTLINRTGMVGR